MQKIRNGRMLSFKGDIYPASTFLRLRDCCRSVCVVEIVQEQEAMGNYKETLSSRHGRVHIRTVLTTGTKICVCPSQSNTQHGRGVKYNSPPPPHQLSNSWQLLAARIGRESY